MGWSKLVSRKGRPLLKKVILAKNSTLLKRDSVSALSSMNEMESRASFLLGLWTKAITLEKSLSSTSANEHALSSQGTMILSRD